MSVVGFDGLRFTEELLTPPPPARLDAVAILTHLAFVTYAVDPERVRRHVPSRFDLHTYLSGNEGPRVWVSLVTFVNRGFHFRGMPRPRLNFGQTNYRTYVIDRVTGQRGVWFFGATLPYISSLMPRYWWSLPWRAGRIEHDCVRDGAAGRYSRYVMRTTSRWANSRIEIEDTGVEVAALDGADDLEGGLVALTHPLHGFCHGRGGRLCDVPVWHDRLHCTAGRLMSARIDLFDRLGVVPFDAQDSPHSVLIHPGAEFVAHLPPLAVRGDES